MGVLDGPKKQTIDIDNIEMINRLRAVDPKKVAELADSIRQIGLMNMPAVRIADSMMIDGEETYGVPILVHGAHRIAALKLLGYKFVTCDVVEVDDLDAELMEIDENLRRANLTPADEAAHLLMRAENFQKRAARDGETGGEIFPTSLQDGRGAGPQHLKQFAAETAAATGKDKSGINKKLAIARDLGVPTLKRLAGTSLDSGVELKTLTKMAPDVREAVIERAASGENISARHTLSGHTKEEPDTTAIQQDFRDWLVTYVPANQLATLATFIHELGSKRTIELIKEVGTPK